MILYVKKVNFVIQKQKIIVLLVLILIPSFVNAFCCPELFVDYSYGGIISHEIDGNHTHQQRISSYSGGVGITWGMLEEGYWLRLKGTYWSKKYEIKPNEINTIERGMIYFILIGHDWLLNSCISVDIGVGISSIGYKIELENTVSGLIKGLHNKRYYAPAINFEITYGISSKIIVLGLTYMYWKSDNYLYALDYNNNPVPIAKKMRRHYVRPYIGVQIGQ